MKLLDLFSGIGGFSVGLERAGFETVAFCENNPKCRHLLAHHWPGVPCFDDVQTLKGSDLPAGIRAICGGFPCQDISTAGLGAGIDGERSGLWSAYARLIDEVRPDFVIVENVAALASRGLGRVLGDMALLGYDAEWDCIRASDVGAPHLRTRLWIVAYTRSVEHEGFGDAFRRSLAEELSGAALADATDGIRRPLARGLGGGEGQGRSESPRWQVREGNGIAGDGGPSACRQLGRAHGQRQLEPEGRERNEWGWSGNSGWWLTEPDVGRVAHGVPARVDRLHGLGNAVIPQIPELIGRAILAAIA